MQEGAAAHIDGGKGQRFIHRHIEAAEPRNAGLVAQRLAQRLAEHNPRVLHRVMGVHLKIAVGADLQPEPAVHTEGLEHVLPTSGTARFFSPLSVDSFVKKSSFISYTREALLPVADDIIRLAEAEGLTAHANSIRVRKEGE